jgi:hypothetical protein
LDEKEIIALLGSVKEAEMMKLSRWSTLLIVVLLVAVTVATGACTSKKANQLPVITSLLAVPMSVTPGGSATVTCIATDPDGDSVIYTWTFTGGSMSGTGYTITWVAPSAANTYVVTVSVSDGKGGVANDSVAISVLAPTPTPAPTEGSIDIKSNPANAEVIIDGVDKGSITPFLATHVAAGNHTVKLVYAHYKWRTENVSVAGGETTYLNWALTYADNVTLPIQPNAAVGKDAWVNQLHPGDNNGSDTSLKTGGDPGETLRTYVQFSFNLPSTAVITSAGLSLWYYDIFPSAGERQLLLHRVTSGWNESLITWNNQPNTSSTVLDTETVPASPTNSFITWDVTNLVKSWVSGTATNYGVMIEDSTGGEDFKVFYSSDWITANQRPTLNITYWDPAPLIID